jgi:hypothetical protein
MSVQCERVSGPFQNLLESSNSDQLDGMKKGERVGRVR